MSQNPPLHDRESAEPDFRTQIDRLIGSHEFGAALAELRRLWRSNRNAATAAFLNQRFRQIADSEAEGRPAFLRHKVAVLRSIAVEPLIPLLRAEAWVHGLEVEVFTGEFDAWHQEAIDENGSLYAFSPETIIVAVETRSLSPVLWGENQDGSALPAEWAKLGEQCEQRLVATVRALRRNCKANIIIHNLALPDRPSDGNLDACSANGQTAAIRRINHKILDFAIEQKGVFPLDYDGLVARFGRERWYDEPRWNRMRFPFGTVPMGRLVDEWMRFLCPLAGRMAKVCVVDLDNTLWGGVVGEDGVQGIRLSSEFPGVAYRNLQQALIALERRGILLAIVSKNNEQDALQAIDGHPSMLLRTGRFSALRINWREKSANIREIAEELNLGLDAFAFVDDNPVERYEVERALPGITVLDIGGDPAGFAAIVRDAPEFSRLVISEEDRQRPSLYAAQRQTSALRETAGSIDEFLEGLDQSMEIAPVNALTLGRAAQMTQKTNQFNLTTKRYTEQQMADLAASPEWGVFTARVRDRFADNGLVALAIVRYGDNECEIDTFLLSCRVISRRVEVAFLNWLIGRAAARGIGQVYGWFVPTRKNAPCRDFYRSNGFTLREETSDGKQRWEIAAGDDVEIPSCIRLIEVTPAALPASV